MHGQALGQVAGHHRLGRGGNRVQPALQLLRGDEAERQGGKDFALSTIDRDLITTYFLHLRDRGYSAASIARKTAALRSFFQYLRRKGEVASDPKLLIAHQPTRGLDVGAIEFVHRRLLQERAEGVGILLVSLESEEIRALADRILVIYEGEIVAEFPPDVSEEDLGVARTGGRGGRAAA